MESSFNLVECRICIILPFVVSFYPIARWYRIDYIREALDTLMTHMVGTLDTLMTHMVGTLDTLMTHMVGTLDPWCHTRWTHGTLSWHTHRTLSWHTHWTHRTLSWQRDKHTHSKLWWHIKLVQTLLQTANVKKVSFDREIRLYFDWF